MKTRWQWDELTVPGEVSPTVMPATAPSTMTATITTTVTGLLISVLSLPRAFAFRCCTRRRAFSQSSGGLSIIDISVSVPGGGG
jgi:hypothetical protein